MTTEIDLYALKCMRELEAAQALTALDTTTLWLIVNLRHWKVKRGAQKADLIAAILAHTHPCPVVTPAVEPFEQMGF